MSWNRLHPISSGQSQIVTRELQKKPPLFIFNKKHSSNSCQLNLEKGDFWKSNVDANEDFNMDNNNLTRDAKSISRSVIGCQENDLFGKKSSYRELSNLCFGMEESQLLEDFQLELIGKGNFRNQNRKKKYNLKLSTSEEIVEEKSNYHSVLDSKSTNFVNVLINRLKEDFQEPENFVPRIQTLTNWRPIFFANWFNESNSLPGQLFLKNIPKSGPEEPTINSIGLKYKLSSKAEDEEKRKILIKKVFKNKSWLEFFHYRKTFQTQSLHNLPLYKTCFSANDPTIKCDCIQCSRNSLKSSKSISEMKIHSSHSFQEMATNSRKIRKQRKQRKIPSRDDNVADGKWKIVKNGNSHKNKIDGKFGKFCNKETSSSDDEWTNHRQKGKNGKSRKNCENPESNLSNESIVFCEDTLSEKLKFKNLSWEEFSQGDTISGDSAIFCETELRKLNNFQGKSVVNYLQRDSVELDILKSIKTRIDEDFVKNVQNLPVSEFSKLQFTPDGKIATETVNPVNSDDFCKNSENSLQTSCGIKIRKNRVSLIPRAIKSVRPLGSRLLRSKMTISTNSGDCENSGWRNLELNETKNSPKRNLIESVDSGIHTDFSHNEQRTEKNSSRSSDDSLVENNKNLNGTEFLSFGIDDGISWSDDDLVARKLEEVVKKLREELYQCEKRIRGRIDEKILLEEEMNDGNLNYKRWKFVKPRSKSSFASSSDFSKNSLLSSGEDFDMNISTPSLSSFPDSEYEKSS